MKVYNYRNVIMRQAWFTYNHLHNIWDNLVFMWNSALREKFNFCFLRDIYQYWHFHFGRRAGHQAIILWNFETFLRSFIVNRSPCSEAAQIYQFIFTNHASFHLWWKENLLKHKKVSKYYEHDCRLW